MGEDTFFEFDLTIKITDRDKVSEKGRNTAMHLENFLRDIRLWQRETEFDIFSIEKLSPKNNKRRVVFEKRR